jgi:hypothetical protein
MNTDSSGHSVTDNFSPFEQAVFCYLDSMSDKEMVVDLLKRLPADAKLRDIGREIEFLAAIREGEEQADRGEVVLHDQVKREFSSWITK